LTNASLLKNQGNRLTNSQTLIESIESVRGKQTGRKTNRQTERQAGRQAGRQADRQTDRQTDRQASQQFHFTYELSRRMIIQERTRKQTQSSPSLWKNYCTHH
jgi:hypothetical protein